MRQVVEGLHRHTYVLSPRDGDEDEMIKEKPIRMWSTLLLAAGLSILLAGCGGFGAQATPLPTRTPLPTFTPTSEAGAVAPVVVADQGQSQQGEAPQPQEGQPAVPVQDAQPAAPTDTPTPPTTA